MLAPVKTRPSGSVARGRAPFRWLAFRAYSAPISCVVQRRRCADWLALSCTIESSVTWQPVVSLRPPLLEYGALIAQPFGSSVLKTAFAPLFVNLSYAYDKTDLVSRQRRLSALGVDSQPYAYNSFASRHPSRLTLGSPRPKLSYAYDKIGSASDLRQAPDLGRPVLSYAYDKMVRRSAGLAASALVARGLSYAYDKIVSALDPDRKSVV